MGKLTLDTDMVIASLLGKDTNAETVQKITKRLDKIVMPWSLNNSSPADHVRCLASGREIAIVTARLGGFAWPHRPWEHGWGYRVSGMGSHHLSGISTIAGTGHVGNSVEECASTALENARTTVDLFLQREFPNLIYLED